jgi:hypothetical protein
MDTQRGLYASHWHQPPTLQVVEVHKDFHPNQFRAAIAS